MEKFKIKVFKDKENPPEIPPLPDDRKNLTNLSLKDFEVVIKGFSDPAFEAGRTSISTTYDGVKCPFCEMRFTRKEESSSWNLIHEPSTCPNCDFPDNVKEAIYALPREKEREN